MAKSIEELKRHTPLILLVELAALLHDIGKLSCSFIDYRQKWQKEEGGWNNDPHEHEFLDKQEKYPAPSEFQTTTKDLGITDPFNDIEYPSSVFETFTIKKVVHGHTDPEKGDLLMEVIKAADSNDSATDRNNPLFSAEQMEGQPVYRSNVFGFESSEVDRDALDSARETLYQKLCPLLTKYLVAADQGFALKPRLDIFEAVRTAFTAGLADTTRPQNDTTLWEHAYAVASISKILTVHNLFCRPKITNAFDENFKYGIWGVGWDGLRFLSYGQKIGDITARKRIIEEIKDKIRNLVEHTYPVGNAVYEDDDGIYFIVPSKLTSDPDGAYINIYRKLEGDILGIVQSLACSEIQPHFEILPECTQLTAIVQVIEGLRKQRSFRFDNSRPNFIKQMAFPGNAEICPICRLRQVDLAVTDDKICDPCRKRRIDSSRINKEIKSQQTIFIDEIVDKHQRAALITARFDLLDWLNGNMVRTLLVTEARGIEGEIERLGTIEDFKNNGQEEAVKEKLKSIYYDYQTIRKDIDALLNDNAITDPHARDIAFLYTYRKPKSVPLLAPGDGKEHNALKALKEFVKKSRDDITSSRDQSILPYNVINAKSPTPSTLLDVWLTTRRFFEKEVAAVLSNDESMAFGRIGLHFKAAVTITPNQAYQARLGHKEVELIFAGQNDYAEIIVSREEIAKLDVKIGSKLILTDKNFASSTKELEVQSVERVPLKAYRIITQSPYVFMAIVPADSAVDLSAKIYRKYQEQFGKVTGRLPFSMGNIFFKRRLPMFVVLDAGRRMLDKFQQLAMEGKSFSVNAITTESKKDPLFSLTLQNQGMPRETQWRVPFSLGNHAPDYYHPYAILSDDTERYSARKGFFKTIAGDILPFTDLEKGDQLSARPNYFDFIFLETNQNRHEIITNTSIDDPLFMEDLETSIRPLWDQFIQGGGLAGITQAKLKNIQALWGSKAIAWGRNSSEFKTLVATTLDKEFPKTDEPRKAFMLETVVNGLFFRMLELQLHILKQKVQPNG